MIFVSENPVYVLDAYRTGTNAVSSPLSNTDLSASNTVPRYTSKPSAVVGDAETILSISWTDSGAGTHARGQEHDLNAAIVLGNIPSTKATIAEASKTFRVPRNGRKIVHLSRSRIQLYKRRKQALGIWGSNNGLRCAQSRLVLR